MVQNYYNQIAVVRLDPTLVAGQLTRTILDPNFRIPTTVAEFGDTLYAVNARYDVLPPPTPNSPPTDPTQLNFNVVGVPK